MHAAECVGVAPAALTADDVECRFHPFAHAAEEDVVKTALRRTIDDLARTAAAPGQCAQQSPRDAQASSAREEEELRSRGLRQVKKELALQEESEALRAASQAHEAKLQRLAEERREALALRAEMRQEAAEEKAARMRAGTQARDAARKAAQAERAARVAAQARRCGEEKAAAREGRAAQHRARFDIVKDRQHLVGYAQEQRQELQREELGCKLQLHQQRSVNGALRAETQKEVQRIARLQHVITVMETRKSAQVEQETRVLTVFDKHHGAAERLDAIREQREAQAASSRRRRRMLDRSAEASRNQAELQRVKRANGILRRSLAKEDYLLSQQYTEKFLAQAKEELRMEQKAVMDENQTRLARVREYQHSVSLAKVEMDGEKQRLRQAAVRKAQREAEERQRMTRLNKERIKEEIEARRRRICEQSPKAAAAAASAAPSPARLRDKKSTPKSAKPEGRSVAVAGGGGAAGAAAGGEEEEEEGESPVLELLRAAAAPPTIQYADETQSFLSGARMWNPAVVFPSYCAGQVRRSIASAPPKLKA